MHVIHAIEMQYNRPKALLVNLYFNSLPPWVGWMEINLSLETNSWKYPGEGGLVKISTKLIDLIRRQIVAICTLKLMIKNKVVINFNMFGTLMENWHVRDILPWYWSEQQQFCFLLHQDGWVTKKKAITCNVLTICGITCPVYTQVSLGSIKTERKLDGYVDYFVIDGTYL